MTSSDVLIRLRGDPASRHNKADLILTRELVEDLPHRSREDALALWEQSRVAAMSG